jgi:hypothetical protein
MTTNVGKKEEIYGLVVNFGKNDLNDDFTGFYASPYFKGDRYTVLKEAKKLGIGKDGNNIFACFSSNEINGFRLESVPTIELDSMFDYSNPLFNYYISSLMSDARIFDSRYFREEAKNIYYGFIFNSGKKDDSTAFYCYPSFTEDHDAVLKQANSLGIGKDGKHIFLCFNSEDKNGFRLEPVDVDWRKVFELKRYSNTLISMAKVGVYPRELALDKITIGLIEASEEFFLDLVKHNGHLGKEFFSTVLTKLRDPKEHLFHKKGRTRYLKPVTLEAFKRGCLPVKLITPELLKTVIMLPMKKGFLESIPFRDALVREGKFPKDDAEAMNWLVSGPEDDDQVRAAELFYQLEYPDIYKEIIQSVRDSYRKQCSSETKEDFVERYIF